MATYDYEGDALDLARQNASTAESYFPHDREGMQAAGTVAIAHGIVALVERIERLVVILEAMMLRG